MVSDFIISVRIIQLAKKCLGLKTYNGDLVGEIKFLSGCRLSNGVKLWGVRDLVTGFGSEWSW